MSLMLQVVGDGPHNEQIASCCLTALSSGHAPEAAGKALAIAAARLCAASKLHSLHALLEVLQSQPQSQVRLTQPLTLKVPLTQP